MDSPQQANPGRPLRIGVTGGRDFADWNLVARTIHALPDGILVHGAAPGADDLCSKWWTRMMGRQDEPHPAEWEHCDESCFHRPRLGPNGNHCPAAGPRRNQQMVDSGLDMLVVFPGGRGTADMRRRSEAANVPIMIARGGCVAVPMGETMHVHGGFNPSILKPEIR